MEQALLEHTDFSYDNAATLPLGGARIAVYADRPHVRHALREDVEAGGWPVAVAAGLDVLFMREERRLEDVILVDCPAPDPETLVLLARLDLRAARERSRLIVSTSQDGLDDVFAFMDQSDPQFLVDPTPADRAIVLAQEMARRGHGRVRELSDTDRMMLMRLTEQVGQIAGRIESLSGKPGAGNDGPSAFAFSPKASTGDPAASNVADFSAQRPARPALPDPRLVRKVIRQRQQRARYFDEALFADPAWDMLLDLTAARAEHARVSVTSLCIASGVPPTTALRWIGQMVEQGVFERVCDESDRRRAFIALSDASAEAIARYFAEIDTSIAAAA